MLHLTVSESTPSLAGHQAWCGFTGAQPGQESPEAELVERILAGDQDAFAELERSYGSALQRLARKQFHFSEPDSEDLVHDMLIALMEKDYRLLRTYRGQAPLGAWLRAVARHRCLDHLRKTAARQRKSYEAAVNEAFRRSGRENQIAVRQALGRLSQRDQVLVRFFFFDGWSYREIAQATQLTESTIASCLFRAKARLRAMLSPDVAAN